MIRIGMVLCAGVLALAACEKDSGLSSKTSGALRQDERTLLGHLPSGNVGLFGGNYLRIQDWVQTSAFSRFMGDLDKVSPGMKAWTSCFADTGKRSLTMLGAISYADDELVVRYVMQGFGVDDVKGCAQKAGFPVEIDADGKFVAIGMPTAMGPVRTGYLVLPDGALLTRSAMPMSLSDTGMAAMPATRAELEADVAAAGRGTAADDAALVAELARIDRDRAVWFVADASATPIGDKLGAMRGWMDLGDGFSVDVSFQVKDTGIADEIARSVPELKKQADMLGKDVGAVIRGIKFDRKGDRIRLALKVTDRQLERLMEQMAPFLGAGMGGGMGGGGMDDF